MKYIKKQIMVCAHIDLVLISDCWWDHRETTLDEHHTREISHSGPFHPVFIQLTHEGRYRSAEGQRIEEI